MRASERSLLSTMALSLRPQQLRWLRPALHRFTSTSQPCLRKSDAVQKMERGKTFPAEFKNGQVNPVFLSSGNAKVDLDTFVRTIHRRIDNLRYSAEARRLLRHKGLHFSSAAELDDLVSQFQEATMQNLKEQIAARNYTHAPYRIPTPDELYKAHAFGGFKAIDEILLNFFNHYCVAYRSPQLAHVDNVRAQQMADMRNPGEWYPEARSMRRKIIIHVAPTNTAKTNQPLKRLETAQSGWYGGPLRLLAHEIFNKMNNKGITCNLRTGEEIRILDPKAPITSSTIEMFQENVEYDVAVIDEIQMIGNQERGYAWTAALLGLRAKEIHLCGEEAAVSLIRKLATELGDEFEVHTYTRLSPLAMEREALKSLQYVEKGDCVVAFSRTSLFSIKNQIEDMTGLKCAMVYGALPPETRALQAELFNDPDSEYDVMVASDAVGMGLNLKIKRIVFYTMEKFDHGAWHRIHNPQIKQIAGRAGRYRLAGTPEDENPGGLVTTLKPYDQKLLRDGIQTPNPPLDKAYLWPPFRVFERFTQQFPEGFPLATLVSQFSQLAHTTPHYTVISSEAQIALAQVIEEDMNIDLETRYNMTFTPIKVRNNQEVLLFKRCVEAYSRGKPITIENFDLDLPLHLVAREQKITKMTLPSLEMLHKMIIVYCWLAIRYPAIFSDYNLALTWKEKTELSIHEALAGMQPREKRALAREKEKKAAKKTRELEARADEGDDHAAQRVAEMAAPHKPRPVYEAVPLGVV